MKALKISLVVIVVATIGSGIFLWIQSIKEPEKIQAPINQFTVMLEKKIEQLKAKPDNKFCKDFYQEIAHNINEFYKPLPPIYPYGRFGKTQSENDQWKENLENNLYVAYVEKFIKQAHTIFHESEWKPENLKFIQAEKNELKKSKLLVAGSPVDKEFTTIQSTLNKYNEIVSFISSCKSYGYLNTELAARFPIAEVQSRLARCGSLLSNRLENEFVNNCTHLHNELKEIPKGMFHAHVRYLDKKIDYWSNLWCNYNSHRDYSSNLNIPIKMEIDDLSNSIIYSGVNVDGECSRLYSKWSIDNQEAYKVIYPCH